MTIEVTPSRAEQDEIDAIRDKREALARARREREEATTHSGRLAAERLALENEEAIEAAEAAHGPLGKRIAAVYTDAGVVIVKRAHAALWKRFQDKGERKTKDLEELLRYCLVHPSLSKFEQLCDDLPVTLTRCANAVAGLAGFRVEENQGK